MRTKHIQASFVAACVTLGVAGCAAKSQEPKWAPAPPPMAAAPVSGTVDENVVSATATVKALDQKTRMVTLQKPDGSLIKFRAGDNVRNLAQVKVGDEVTVSYYESLAYEVKKPGTAAPGVAMAEGVGRAKLGEKPGAVGAQVTTVTATIAAIDTAAGTVTLKGPEGDLTTIKARDPQRLTLVSVGDLVEITYTEALGISVDEATK